MKKLIAILTGVLLVFIFAVISHGADTPTPYGGIKFNNESAGYIAEIDASVAGTYYGFINGGAADNLSGFTFNEDDTNGDYLELTQTGLVNQPFHAIGGVSFAIASPSGEAVHCDLFINGTETDIAFERVIGAGGDIGSAPLVPDIIDLTTGDKVRMKCTTDGTNETIEIYHVGFTLERKLTVDSDSANDHTHSSTQIIDNQPGTPCYGCARY